MSDETSGPGIAIDLVVPELTNPRLVFNLLLAPAIVAVLLLGVLVSVALLLLNVLKLVL